MKVLKRTCSTVLQITGTRQAVDRPGLSRAQHTSLRCTYIRPPTGPLEGRAQVPVCTGERRPHWACSQGRCFQSTVPKSLPGANTQILSIL